MRSPYDDLPPQAFWRTAIVRQKPEALAHLYHPKFDLTANTAIMTAGSCFAQHIHRSLSTAGWHVLQHESRADIMPLKLAKQYGYDVYSARYGNIYTARQLLQLLTEALNDTPTAPLIWQKDGRYYDALRPSIEPEGFASRDSVIHARQEHLRAVRALLQQTECIVFTLGLTECWIDSATGRALPTAPGTVAGDYDSSQTHFHNFTHSEVLADLRAARDLLKSHGLAHRFLLTVSPVPLTATATGNHIGTASTYSKSVLRGVCGELDQTDPDFSYFPSYEIITTAVAGGPHFAKNMRSPTPEGVDAVLGIFAMSHATDTATTPPSVPVPPTDDTAATEEDDLICEEALLEAFSK